MLAIELSRVKTLLGYCISKYKKLNCLEGLGYKILDGGDFYIISKAVGTGIDLGIVYNACKSVKSMYIVVDKALENILDYGISSSKSLTLGVYKCKGLVSITNNRLSLRALVYNSKTNTYTIKTHNYADTGYIVGKHILTGIGTEVKSKGLYLRYLFNYGKDLYYIKISDNVKD